MANTSLFSRDSSADRAAHAAFSQLPLPLPRPVIRTYARKDKERIMRATLRRERLASATEQPLISMTRLDADQRLKRNRNELVVAATFRSHSKTVLKGEARLTDPETSPTTKSKMNDLLDKLGKPQLLQTLEEVNHIAWIGVPFPFSKADFNNVIEKLQNGRQPHAPAKVFAYRCPFCNATITKSPTPSPEQLSIIQDLQLVLKNGQGSMSNLNCWSAPELRATFNGLFLDCR
ncbi:hypothetical protein CPB83DRAFT_841415 [Crepidotus variabilis]|uniref:Uncharacterized protein n=1 Tax=Crepidotus variabilis TaxID=179855 RepID=A0A9P6BBC3_9AGAR|nr:hypothetical protein CPB83DRAFT_841415 [Crepidotus variabilis]